MEAHDRIERIQYLQEYYKDPVDFLHASMNFLGFEATEVQEDIMRYLTDPTEKKSMVQAQRSQAKSTVTAISAVWWLIQDPTERIMILSAGEKRAKEISSLIIQLITNWDILECLRPDARGRSSVEAFDVHYVLKGVDKSPSVACMGVGGNLQGARADRLIADDIESSKNSQTASMREHLTQLTRDFASICTNGQIIFLGTPQSKDSIYNSLPQRGYTVRIWTGRYPTPEQVGNYKGLLAPYILDKIAENPLLQTGGGIQGDVGQPVDPVLLDEEALQAKELDQGKAYFQLQHMLDTRLLDEGLYPLNLSDLVILGTNKDKAPIDITHAPREQLRFQPPQGSAVTADLYRPVQISEYWEPYQFKMMYIDPAGGGQNADETAYSVVGVLNGQYFLLDMGGIPGGYYDKAYKQLGKIALEYGVNNIGIESNFGNGAFRVALQPILKTMGYTGGIEDIWVSTQKELRIIEALEAIMSGNRLIVNERLFEKDVSSVLQYDIEKQPGYQLFFQMQNVTKRKGCLEHDDRLDALAGCLKLHLDHARKVINTERRMNDSDMFLKTLHDKHPQLKSQNKQNNQITSFKRSQTGFNRSSDTFYNK